MKFAMGDRHKSIARMHRETGVWASLNHENVLKLHGLLYRSNNSLPSLVADYMEKGTAEQYLRCCPNANLVDVIRDAAKGLSHLHEREIAHGDVKGDNILVGGDCRARIADFGLSRMLGTDGLPVEVTTTDANRSHRWHAVEYFKFPTRIIGPTKPADVWSFGCTILQLFSGKWPFYDAIEAEVTIRLSQGELPKFPVIASRPDHEKYRPGIVAFCHLCWMKDPDFRPRMRMLEELACSDFWKETVTDGTKQDVVSSVVAFPRQEYSLPSEDGESGISPVNPLVDSLRSLSSSELTVLGTPPRIEDFPEEALPLKAAPSPPPPSLEDILSARRIIPRIILNEFAMVTNTTIEYVDGESTSSSQPPEHVVTCRVNGEVYGVGVASGKKRQAKERAAFVALHRLYVENPSHFNTLRYLPIFKEYLEKSHFASRVTWSTTVERRPEGTGELIFKTTFSFDGNVVATGIGATFDLAEEHAARKVRVEWSEGIVNAA